MAASRIAALGAIVVAFGACTGGAGEGPERPSPPSPVAIEDGGAVGLASSAKGPPDAEVDAGPVLSEAVARTLVTARFRAAGFRIRNDVLLSGEGFELTVDGYDPKRNVGFEYIATGEVGTDLSDAERAALSRDSERRVLVLDAGDERTLLAAVDAFLAATAPDTGDDGQR